jgi:hypothetical protein
VEIIQHVEVERVRNVDRNLMIGLKARKHFVKLGVVDRKILHHVWVNVLDLEVSLVRDIDLVTHDLDEIVGENVVLLEENVSEKATFQTLELEGLLELRFGERRVLDEKLADPFL